MVECEVGYQEGGFNWRGLFFTLALTVLFCPFGIWFILFQWRPKVVSHGKGYEVPIFACAQCRKLLAKTETLKSCLQRIPVYDRLLKKYPDARVYLMGK
jgi:hypothetical protein